MGCLPACDERMDEVVAFSLEANVANGKHLVYQQEVRIGVGCHGKA